jgi:hypothetical protein
MGTYVEFDNIETNSKSIYFLFCYAIKQLKDQYPTYIKQSPDNNYKFTKIGLSIILRDLDDMKYSNKRIDNYFKYHCEWHEFNGDKTEWEKKEKDYIMKIIDGLKYYLTKALYNLILENRKICNAVFV